MKRIISWFQNHLSKDVSSDTPQVLEDVTDACMTSGSLASGVNLVMHRYYRESVF